MNKFDIKSKNKLDNENRRRTFPAIETLESLGLKKDMDVADIGEGIGYFTFPISDYISKSQKIYGLDISQDMVDYLKEGKKRKALDNLTVVKTREDDFGLEENIVDFSLIVNVLHEVEDSLEFLKEVVSITKNRGYISIIDFKKERINNEGPPEKIRLSIEEVENLFDRLSVERVKNIDFGESHYGIVGRVRK